MSLSVNNRDSSTSILSFKEIIGIVIVFSLMLYLLFPKDNIDEIIEQKGKNTNLSINYLESMLLYYPDNIKLQMILLNNYTSANKREKAFALINKLLSQTDDKEVLTEVLKTEYILLKERYFKKKDKKLRAEIKDKLYKYFEFTKGNRDYMFFLTEASQMDFRKLKYISLKGLIQQKPEIVDYNLEKELYYLALSLGYKKEATNYLLKLTTYSNVDRDFKDNALSIMLQDKKYKEAIALSTKLFLHAEKRKEIENYFNIALYATAIQDGNNTIALRDLIDLYKNSREIKAYNIKFILDNLLKVGDIKGASDFAQNAFKEYPNEFDESNIDLAIKSLIYNQELKTALDIALFAKDKFNSSKWLDKAIELSIWQGKMQDAVKLNIIGFRVFKDKKYERYLLEKSNFNRSYKIQGEIYRSKLNSGDYSQIENVAKYYEYSAKTAEGEKYFYKLYKKTKNRELLKQAISFSYKNNHYKKGLKLYNTYKSKYGIDKILQKESIKKLIALKEFKKAYNFLKELEREQKNDKRLNAILKKLNMHKDEGEANIYKKLMDFAWIFKDYKYIYKVLWKLEKRGELKEGGYNKLALLEKELNHGKKLAYLYNKSFEKTGKRAYITALLYLYMDNREYKKFGKILKSIKKKDKKVFEKDLNYHILLANYYVNISKIKEAKEEFKKAFKVDKKNISTHQAYIWFLIDNRFNKLLKKELRVLRKNPKLQRGVGFPSVVGALMFQHTDLALKWLRPLLKASSSLEYQIVYSDILQLQDRVNGANKVRLKLFKKLNRMIRKNPKLLKDKAFARVYLRLVVMFVTPYERKNLYFKKFKKLFKQKDFMEMKLGWKSYIQSEDEVKYLASKYNMNIPWLNLYLAMSRGDNTAKQDLVKNYKDILAFRDRVTASKDIGDIAGAYSLAFKGMEDNRRDTDLYKIYEGMVNRDFPKGNIKTKYKNLSKSIDLIEERVSYRWSLYKGIESKFSFNQYRYIKKKSKDLLDSKIGISINNSHKNFIWKFEIAKHFAQKDFISSLLDLSYQNSEFRVEVKAKYQNKTNQTTQLQMIGIQNSIKVTVTRKLSKRVAIGVSYRNSQYKTQTKDDMGGVQELKVSASYLVRGGYPDMHLSTYMLISRFRDVKKDILPKNYTELGTQVSIGAVKNQEIHRDWRPFGLFGLSINNRQDIGTSLSLGVSGEVMGEDLLNLSFDYSKGINMISYPSYGVNINYRF